jgi:hypothetical protein
MIYLVALYIEISWSLAMSTLKKSTALVAVIGACLLSSTWLSSALADAPQKVQKSDSAKSSESADSGAAQAGMKAYVDPETGQLVSRPTTAADAAALDSAFQEDYSKIQEIHKADGSTEWVFNGQVDSAMVATRGADGKLMVTCQEHGVVHDHLDAPVPVGLGGRDEK